MCDLSMCVCFVRLVIPITTLLSAVVIFAPKIWFQDSLLGSEMGGDTKDKRIARMSKKELLTLQGNLRAMQLLVEEQLLLKGGKPGSPGDSGGSPIGSGVSSFSESRMPSESQKSTMMSRQTPGLGSASSGNTDHLHEIQLETIPPSR